MNDRLFQFIESLGISPTEFADKTGINRSTLSGIKTGRTQPTLAIYEKIKNTYPSVNIENLMFGNETAPTVNSHDLENIQPTLDFNDESVETTNIYKNSDNSNISEKSNFSGVPEIKGNQATSVSSEKTRKVVKAIIFYDDNTFEVLTPQMNEIFSK